MTDVVLGHGDKQSGNSARSGRISELFLKRFANANKEPYSSKRVLIN
jgi:hypothetical protein